MAKSIKRRHKKKTYSHNKNGKRANKTSKQFNALPFSRVIINAGYLVVTIVLFYSMTNLNQGYDWLINSLIKNTYSTEQQVKALTKDQKLESKLGFDVKYLFFLRDNTPKDAVILMPSKENIKRKKEGGAFANNSAYIGNIAWASYFVHPRKLVYENGGSYYGNSITHVAIIDKWGYQFFPDIPESNQQQYAVLKK